MSDKNRFLSSRSARFLRLSGLTARVSTSYTGQRLKEFFLDARSAAGSRTQAHIRNAERIVKTLGELKGAAMKVGQAMSIHADILPREFAEILASLQRSAPPMPYEVVESQIISEFGKPPEALFARFDRDPHASASVGQVHRAALGDGTEVVVKIQYPGVDDNLDGDMKNLKTILSMGSIVGYRKRDLDGMFAEIRDRLVEELDYDQERESVKIFRELFRNDPRVLIPRVFPPYCSRRVLTMEYLPGDPLEALLSPPYTQEDRNHFGCLIFDLYAYQILHLGLLHADPHPGNYAFRKDGRLVLYDFGCLKRVSPETRANLREVVLCGLNGQYDRIDEVLLKLGARDPEKESPGSEFYRMYVEVFRKPFERGEAFDFGEASLHEMLLDLIPQGVAKMLCFQPSPETIFINRVIGGHYGNLKRLRARACWLDILEPYLTGTGKTPGIG